MAAIVEGFASQAFCMACARFETKVKPSSKVSAPAATSAENSPSEWPATMSGAKSFTVLASNTECKKMAGCVTLVCFKSSAMPSNIISVILKPRIALAFSNNAFTLAEFSYKSFPIPGYCAPCPGKT